MGVVGAGALSTAAPANDNFANAVVLTGSSATATGTTVGATKESGEPLVDSGSFGETVWYRWQAPASGPTVVDTYGSAITTSLGVFTGSSVSALTLVASNV